MTNKRDIDLKSKQTSPVERASAGSEIASEGSRVVLGTVIEYANLNIYMYIHSTAQ